MDMKLEDLESNWLTKIETNAIRSKREMKVRQLF
jgi:hypothetical protein